MQIHIFQHQQCQLKKLLSWAHIYASPFILSALVTAFPKHTSQLKTFTSECMSVIVICITSNRSFFFFFFFSDTGYFLWNNLRIEHKSIWRCCQTSLDQLVTCYLQAVQLHQKGINGAQCPPQWDVQLLGDGSQKKNESANKFHSKTQRLAKWNQENRVQDNKQQWQRQSWVKAFGVWKGSNKSLPVASVLQRMCWNVQEWRYRQPAYVTRKITCS